MSELELKPNIEKTSLSNLQEQLDALKSQHDQEKGRENERYKDLVQMAVEMAGGNVKLAQATDRSYLTFPSLPDAHRKSLYEFEINRKQEIEDRTLDLKAKTEKLESVKSNFQSLQEAGALTEEQLHQFEAQIQEEEAILAGESEAIKTLGSTLKDDYNDLAEKFRKIETKQDNIAANPGEFAIETVLEMNKDDMTEEQIASFKADVEQVLKEQQNEAWATKQLEEKMEFLKFEEGVVEEFAQRLSAIKAKIEAHMPAFATISPDVKVQLAPELKSRLQEHQKQIEKLLGSLYMTSGKAKDTEQLIRELRAMYDLYRDQYYEIHNTLINFLNDASHQDQNKDGQVMGLGRVTLREIGESDNSLTWVKQPNLQNKVSELNDQARIVQMRAKVLSKEINSYCKKTQEAMEEFRKQLEGLCDSKIREYAAKLNQRR